MRCPKCKSEIRQDIRFCENCGFDTYEIEQVQEGPFNENKNTCPECNSTVREGTKFCENCGAQYDQKGATSAQTKGTKTRRKSPVMLRGTFLFISILVLSIITFLVYDFATHEVSIFHSKSLADGAVSSMYPGLTSKDCTNNNLINRFQSVNQYYYSAENYIEFEDGTRVNYSRAATVLVDRNTGLVEVFIIQ